MLKDLKIIFGDLIMLLILILYCSSNILGYTFAGKIMMTALIFIITFLEIKELINNKIKWSFSFSILLLFLIWGLLSYYWALDNSFVLKRFFSLFLLDLFYIMSYNRFIRRNDSIDIITTIIIVSGIVMSCFLIVYFGIGNYFLLLSKGRRVSVEWLNVNSIGLNAARSVTCCLYRMLKEKKYSYVFLMIIPLIVSFGSGSRKVLIFLFVSIFVLVLFQKSKSIFDFSGKIIKFAFVILVFYLILQIPAFNTINSRFKSFTNFFSDENVIVDESTKERYNLINTGIDTWKNHFLLGIGLSATSSEEIGFGVYFHNNYVELLATLGIIGFFLYYLLYFTSFFKVLYSNYSLEKIFVLLLIILNLFMDFAVVSYYSFQTYIILLLVFYYVSQNNKEVV